MAKNTANRTQGAKLLIERAEIMVAARGAKKTGSTKCEINILQSRKVGEVGMIDKEKVIKGLETHIKPNSKCVGCPYPNNGLCGDQLYHDALALLKEQEAEIEHMKRPDCEHAEHDGIGCLGYCGCTQDDEPIESCKRCEKYTGNVYEAVKWE